MKQKTITYSTQNLILFYHIMQLMAIIILKASEFFGVLHL